MLLSLVNFKTRLKHVNNPLVIACNNFVRYIMAGVGSLIASDIQRAMGNGPLFTFGGALLIVFFINVMIVRRYPKKWAVLRE